MRVVLAAAVSVASASVDSSRYLVSSEGSHLALSANATFTQYLCNGASSVLASAALPSINNAPTARHGQS